jgi:hypothetical protein
VHFAFDVYNCLTHDSLATEREDMNDPYDSHPNHPANQAELVARFGYINPNQFPEGRDLKGEADETLDIEEAEAIAQMLADEFGVAVTVDVTDEDGMALEPLVVECTLVQEMNGPHPQHEEDLSNEIAF